MQRLDETHDPARASWVAGADTPGSEFPIQNLPFCVFSTPDRRQRTGVCIGERVVDVEALIDRDLLRGEALAAAILARGDSLNALMEAGRAPARALRRALADLLDVRGPHANEARRSADTILVDRRSARFHLPTRIGGFTDFLTSTYHTERGGRHTRPDAPLPPAFKHLPIAYNSRPSSVRISGEPVIRPHGQFPDRDGRIVFGPTRAFDFELEVGLFIAGNNALGAPVPIGEAEERMLGLVLLNDWSSRDVQRWESHPLGPFLSKSVSTTISPFVVTLDALEPFRTTRFARAPEDPAPLSYLDDPTDAARGGFDIALTCDLESARMRARGREPARITRTNFRHMYWTFAQMLTHHTSNGCNLQAGDLLGSGTTSGPTDEARACFAELSERGTIPLDIGDSETRGFLEEGDEVVFRGRAERSGFAPIGFGTCIGRVEPAIPYPVANPRGV